MKDVAARAIVEVVERFVYSRGRVMAGVRFSARVSTRVGWLERQGGWR